MAELAMLADIQQTVCPEEASGQLHVMEQARKSSTVINYTASVREFGELEPHRQLVSVGYDTVKHAKYRC